MNLEELIVLSLNVRSLTATKRDHVLRVANMQNAHVICIQETWLAQESKLPAAFLQDYQIFRKDRNRSGGGVLVAVRRGVQVLRASVHPTLELVEVEIQITSSAMKSLWIGSLYIPPGANGPDSDQGPGEPSGCRFLFWDLNVESKPEWSDARIEEGWSLRMPQGPTHTRGGILDGALLTSTAEAQGVATYILHEWIGDHACLVHRIRSRTEVASHIHQKQWVYSKADWSGYKEKLRGECTRMEGVQSASGMYSALVSFIGKAARAHIPRAPRRSKPAFWTSELESLRSTAVRCRQAVSGAWRQGTTPDDTLLRAAASSAAALKAAIKAAQRESWKSFQVIESGPLADGKAFWRYIRRLRLEGPTREVAGAVRDPRGDLITGPNADRLVREHLLRNSRETRKQLREFPPPPFPVAEAIQDSELRTHLHMEELQLSLSRLRNGSACGTDNISVKMLKELPEEGLQLLLELANKIWVEGRMPGRLKEVRLIRLEKPNSVDPYAIENSRFISVEQCIARVVESMIAARLGKILEDHRLLPSEMHGFRKGRSTVSALRTLLRETRTHGRHCTCCNGGRLSGLLCLDFSKFFDRVSSRVLRDKMLALGIDGKMVRFVGNWMVGRLARINVQTGVCARSRVGLPQGSPLSCALANIYIIDLIVGMTQSGFVVTNYADDISVLAKSSSKVAPLRVQADEVSSRLQDALAIAGSWARESGAKLNSSKSTLSCFLPTNNRFDGKVLDLMSVTGVMKVVEPVVLGATFDRFGIGGKHVAARIAIARKRVGALKTLPHVALAVLRKLYVAGVRPALLYGIESFESITPTAFSHLEALQSTTLKFICRLRHGVNHLVVGRLLRVPPIRLVVECRWKIREGMSRQDARAWLTAEWDRITPEAHRVPISTREDPLWGLPRSLQVVVLRARSGQTLLHQPEAQLQLCNNPRCHDLGTGELSVKHILLDCLKFASKRRALKVAVPGSFTVENLLWPHGQGAERTLALTAQFLIAVKA